MADTDYVTLGKLGAPYGIKGWVRLFSYTEPAENILDYSRFLVRQGGSLLNLEVDQSRAQGNGFVVLIRGCEDRDQARQYTGSELLVEKAALPDPGDNQFYWYQLQELQVINLQGQNLGKVDHLLGTGANDVLVVKPTPDSVDDQQRLIPYVWERIVTRVDPDNDCITVDWPSSY